MNRMSKLLAMLVAPLVLTGCLFLPGKFDANLKLTQGGQYQFTYVGEMQIFAGDDKDMKKPVWKEFDPERVRCNNGSSIEIPSDMTDEKITSDIGSDEPVEYSRCSDEEIEQIKRDNIEFYEKDKREYEQRSGMMAAMFGGAVPGNDEALTKFAETLLKYDGWEKVEYAGDNVFNVEYRASGNFDRYFAFPVLNDASMQYPFFQVVPRKSGELEIMSPGLGGQGGLMGMAMLGGMPSGARMSNDLPIKPITGSFTIETDGEVVGNNSPDGYVSEGGLKVMRWDVENLSESPRALVKIN